MTTAGGDILANAPRNWRIFCYRAFTALGSIAIGSALLPIFHFLMDPNWERPNYLGSLAVTFRIGISIGLVFWVLWTVLLAILYSISPTYFSRFNTSVSMRIAAGLMFMPVAMWPVNKFEEVHFGRSFHLEGWTTGFFIGATIYMLSTFIYAYRHAREHNLRLRAESAEANLHVLKSQMHPHFLFNSLNAMSELIETDQSGAAEMTQKLSDLYREILLNSKQQLSTLESEISIARKYLELERLRFGDRLDFKISVGEGVSSKTVYVPSLIMQTLVENAVKHGIAPSRQGGHIEVRIRPERAGFKVDVQNSLADDGRAASAGSGTGIANTRTRLDLLYGDRHGFELKDGDGIKTASFWCSGDRGSHAT